MTIRIGHASIDENGAAVGGTAGDQTGREVCIRNWYDGGWSFLARAKDAAIRQKIAAACEAGCANANIGYDQNQRNTLNTQAQKVGYDLTKIDTPCETDCSAFVTVCIRAAGVAVPDSAGNAPTTRTLQTVLTDTGAFHIFTGSSYLTATDDLCRGDILVKPGSHTVIVLDEGVKKETGLPLLKVGSIGPTVRALQILLMGFGFDCGSCGADGEYGSDTKSAVIACQKAHGLQTDGITGDQTWSALLGI